MEPPRKPGLTTSHLKIVRRKPKFCISTGYTLDEIEREIILAFLHRNKWHRIHTAAALGITVKTLYNKIIAYNLDESEHSNVTVVLNYL